MRITPALLAISVMVLAACGTDPSAALSPVEPTGGAPLLALAPGAAVAVVTEANIVRQAENTPPTASWVLYTRNAGAGAFQVGPSTAPEGVGSLSMQTPTSADKLFLFNYEHIDTRLADITRLEYATYRTSGTANQLPALNIQVDFNGAVEGGFTTLVFEPVYNTAQGAVTSGSWQAWDAHLGGDARWWSTRAIGGACAFDCFVSWSTIVENNPEAVILGGIGVNQGSGNAALDAAVDALVLGVGPDQVTYDFEPYVTPATRDACKDNGWQVARRGDGTAFRNQGDCVSYVNGRA